MTSHFAGVLRLLPFFVCLLISLIPHFRNSTTEYAHLFLLTFTVVATLFSVARTLPWQNVFSIAAIILFATSVAEIINTRTGLPFGHRDYSYSSIFQLFKFLPWPAPFIWLVAILNSRGVARVLLQPRRRSQIYGYLVIAMTVALTVDFLFNLRRFAAIHHYWLSPDFNIIGSAIFSLILLLILTPWFINKKPAPQPPPDYQSLIIWLSLNLLFIV